MTHIKAHSHRMLGRFLADQYLCGAPRRYVRAFLFGCTEPDKNPATYLKGTLRVQPLRGHNWQSAQKYMQRIARRLERRKKLRLLDYYTLGKLIHYITDAFTHTHNASFREDLLAHRRYEHQLQDRFLAMLDTLPHCSRGISGSIMDAIFSFHREYSRTDAGVDTDCRYTLLAAHHVLRMLLGVGNSTAAAGI